MKKLMIFLLLLLLSLLAYGACADEATGNITASVNVSGSFFLIVNSDSFDFASLMPGQTGEMSRTEGITVTGSSAGGDPWYLKVAVVSALSSGSDFIPNENFTWNGTSEGKGSWYGSVDRSFAGGSNTAYISSRDESASGAKVASKFNFRLTVPEDTKPGSYTTTVMFTLTE